MELMEWFTVAVFIAFLVTLGIIAGIAIRRAHKKSTRNRKPSKIHVTAQPSVETPVTRETQTMSAPRLSVATWSLRRQLGAPEPTGPEQDMKIPTETHGKGTVSLLELPAHVAKFGIHTLEICHFHLPSVEKTYLADLRASLTDAGVELFSLLIDDGDITHPSNAKREIAWIEKWIDIAGELDAKCARVIGGKADPSPETIAQSRNVLAQLSERADTAGLRLMSENSHYIFSNPENVKTILEGLDGKVGLCLDFGNWGGSTKYTNLELIAPWAESCHTKAYFPAPLKIDKEDYVQCLEILQSSGFAGPYTLIYDGPGEDEWKSLEIEREVVEPYLKHAASQSTL